MSYPGTGVTAGPYSLSLDSALTCADPAASTGIASKRVQIQNQSGYTVSVQGAGAPYTIPALQASTIPTLGDGSPITLTATGGSSATSTGSVTLIWLLDGQSSPMPDGPLVQTGSTSTTASSVGVAPSVTLAPLGNANLCKLVLNLYFSFTTTSITVTGETSGIVYLSTSTSLASTSYIFPIIPNLDENLSIDVFGSTDVYELTLTLSSNVAAPADTVTYGGFLFASQTGITAGTTVTALAAPPAGYVYRIHSVSLNKQLGSASDYCTLKGSNGQVFACLTQNQTTIYLGGRLISTAVSFINDSTGTTIAFEIGYDIVSAPAII